LALVCLQPSFVKGRQLIQLDREGITSTLNNYKAEFGLIDDFSFISQDLNDIAMDKA
jgi:hypothetical protein